MKALIEIYKKKLISFLKEFKEKKPKLFRGICIGIGGCILLWIGMTIWNWNKLDFQGYIEGEFVYVGSPIGGRLEKLHVHRGDWVQKDTLLFELERAMEGFSQEGAEARWKEAEAGFKLAQANFTRGKTLLAQNVISQKEFDEIEKNLKSAEQTVVALRQDRAQSGWKWDQKSQAARSDALVHDTYFNVGEWVPEGKPIVALLPPENVKVRFFVSEKTLGKIKAGQKLAVHVEGVWGEIEGKVSYISAKAEYTPPVIYSVESRAKLVFLVEGSFSPENAKKLHPGQPVDVRVFLKKFYEWRTCN